MFDYLTKFKQLPKELQAVASSPPALQKVSELEKKYGVDLAAAVIKIMTKEIPWNGLVDFFVVEHHLAREQASRLQDEMATKIFSSVTRYLGIEGQKLEVRSKKLEEEKEIGKIQAPSFKPQMSSVKPQTLSPKPQAPSFKSPGSNKEKEQTEDNLTEKILAEAAAQISLPNEGMKVRLKNILLTFVKGIRDFLYAREALMKEPANGGLGLTREQAESALNLIKQKKEGQDALLEIPTKKALAQSWNELRDVEYDFSQLPQRTPVKQPPAEAPKEEKPKVDLKQELTELSKEIISPKEEEPKLAPPPPIIRNQNLPHEIKPGAISQGEEIINHKSKIQKPEKIQPAMKNMVQMQRPISRAEQDKPRMDDIMQPPSRLQGPIEELANLDLVNWRRLGGSPEVVISKVKNKIKLLEEESFTRRQQGVNAWRQSPVYKMYVDLGQQSLLGGKPVEELIKVNAVRKDSMTVEEFNAILELNRQLRV